MLMVMDLPIDKIAFYESALLSAKSLKERVDAINLLAFEIRNTDTSRSIYLCNEAQEISLQIKYPEGHAQALANEGFCYVQITNYDLALDKSYEALKIFEELKHPAGIALVNYNICLVYQRIGNYELALENISKSLSIQRTLANDFEVSRCLLQLGLLYYYLNDHVSALDVYQEALKLSKKLHNKALEASIQMGMGQSYLQLKDYQKSQDFLMKSLTVRGQIKDWRGYNASMSAYVSFCFETGDYKEAENYSCKGINLSTELGDKMGVVRFTNDLAKTYLLQKRVDEAEALLLDILGSANENNLRNTLIPIHFALYEIYRAKGDFETALNHHEFYHKVKEELQFTEALLKAKNFQFAAKVDNALKEAEINRLKNVELKRAEAEILSKNRILQIQNQELEQFAYVASHDLQEPLRTVSSFVDFLKIEYYGKLDDQADQYMTFITNSTKRMQDLVKGLLDFSRIGKEKVSSTVDCNIIVEDVLFDLSVLIKESNAELKIHKLPVINGYPLDIRQLFQNLISNAIKFRKKDVNPIISINAKKQTHGWLFSIHDNGIGIQDHDREKIFIIFKRLHNRHEYEGTGIGLSLCKKIVELHNGTIWVESQPNEGCVFYFTILNT